MISLVRGQAERLRPPRVLHCEFPLGRPLGVPNDPAFQHRVLRAAFDLLRMDEPVLVDFPQEIREAGDDPLACALPPQHDPTLHPAVDEARGLREAYDRRLARGARTLVGRAVSPDRVPDAVGAFVAVADGGRVDIVAALGEPGDVAMDIRAYYEEAASEIAAHVPAARAAERWFFQRTVTGRVLIDAKHRLREAGLPRTAWYHLVPRTQDPDQDWNAPD